MQKKIVYILPDKDAGVVSVVRNLLKYKSDRFKTKVLLIREKGLSHRHIKDKLNCDEQLFITIDSKKETKISVSKKIFPHIHNSSLIISNDGGHELLAIGLYRLSIPVIYILHGNIEYYYNCIKKYGYLLDTVITVSNYLFCKTNEIKQQKKFSFKTFDVKIPVPDANQIERKDEHEEIRIVFIGSLVQAKGVLLFKDICRILENNRIKFQLDIIGDGPLKSQLENDFRSNQNIILHGNLPNQEVLTKLSYFDIILSCSYTEGMPVTIIEGMKNGLVPVTSNLPSGIPEIVIDGKTGYKISTENINKFANCLMFLYHHSDILKKMSIEAQKLANEKFNPIIQTQKFEDIYMQIIDNYQIKTFKKIALKEKLAYYLPNHINYLTHNFSKIIKRKLLK